MIDKRSSGILLHVSSLSGPDGIGDLGLDAYRWIDFLAESKCAIWQTLPLGPTGFGNSPYQSFSAFAGNPNLISLQKLCDQNLITEDDLSIRPQFNQFKVDYQKVNEWKQNILSLAFENYKSRSNNITRNLYDKFFEDNKYWIEDFGLFLALKEFHNGHPWNMWKYSLKKRELSALNEFRSQLSHEIEFHIFQQFIFFNQWDSLHQYANQCGIKILGDLPIFIAMDSVDTWSSPDLFLLDENDQPLYVAGVPPDYFSDTGQLWGNPLYQWNNHIESNFHWWLDRIKFTLKQFDLLRIDHFRGFCANWQIPAGMPTAEIGEWSPGPGSRFFDTLMTTLGDLPFIAEDLGDITLDVVELRERYNLPGMKILQFAFSNGSSNPFLPHNYPVLCVAYTGTHDNDTSLGWFENSTNQERCHFTEYTNSNHEDVSWDMIRAIWASVAQVAIAPLQDFLSLNSEARMNYPGTKSNNWAWRVDANQIDTKLTERVKKINTLYGRAIL